MTKCIIDTFFQIIMMIKLSSINTTLLFGSEGYVGGNLYHGIKKQYQTPFYLWFMYQNIAGLFTAIIDMCFFLFVVIFQKLSTKFVFKLCINLFPNLYVFVRCP